MFSKPAPDPAITGREKYRGPRPQCSGLRVAKPELDPATFRSLIECFGANGSIPEIAKLVAEASDRTIRQSVDLLNATFLADARTRSDSRGIVRGLERRGRWEPALAGFAPALRDPGRLRALVRLLAVDGRASMVVKTFRRFDPEETMAGVELVARLARTRAFAELSRKIRFDPLAPGERDRLVELVADFFRRPTPLRSAGALLEDMAAGKSAPVWPFAFGGDGNGSVLEAASRLTLLLRDLAGPEGLSRLARFHVGFHRPVSCWGGGKVFPEPWRNLARELGLHAARGETELTKFVGRFVPLTALGIPELCAVPEEFYAHFPAVMRLTAGRTGGEYVRLLGRIFDGGLGLSAGYFVGEWGEPLAEALTILERKPWFGDLVLLVAELDAGDRDRLAGWTRALLRERPAWTAAVAEWRKADLDPVFADLGRVLGAPPADLAATFDSLTELFESARVHPWFDGWKRISAEAKSNGVESLVDLRAFPEAAEAVARMAEDGRLAAILGDVLDLLAGSDEKPTVFAATAPAVRKAPRHALVGDDLRPIETPPAMDASLLACARLDLRKTPGTQWDLYEACLGGGGVDSRAFAGLRAARAWEMADGSGSFIDSLVASAVSLPLTSAEKREFIAMITGKRSGLPALSPDAIREAIARIRARIGIDGGLGGPTRLFALLHRFQVDLRLARAHWEEFFGKIARALEDPRFVRVVRAWRALEDPAAKGDVRVAPAPPAPAAETGAWVAALECERDGRRAVERAAEIDREFSEGVLGWERPGGKLPLRWDAAALEPRLRAFAESLTPELRANLYAWLAGLDPKAAAEWFLARAVDPRLVAVMDPETKRLRVRWMTSLDRLESVLVNSNFTYLLNGNYGLKFIAKFAEAWGDEPRERWPREIRERYSGRRSPPRLADVYDEIVAFLRWFEAFGGIPGVPDCVERDGAVARAAIDDPRRTAPDLLIPFSVKAKAFNLRQTLSVVRENLPGAGGAGAEGMRFLRDLFWAVHSSAPRADRDPGRPERNPIRFLQDLGGLGGLRSISRGLQSLEFASERAALADAFAGLRAAVAEPAFDRILGRLVRDPSAIETIAAAAVGAPDFDVGTLSFGALSALAADRTTRIAAPLLRFAETLLGRDGEGLPAALLADVVVRAGERGEEPARLRTARAPTAEARAAMAGLADFLERRGLAALGSFPMRDAIRRLDADAALRARLFAELDRWTAEDPRQSDGERAKLAPYLDLILSTERPEVRRAIALWCGRSAGRYAYELAARPDEALLMIDGMLQAGRSEAFADFIDALLRELAD